MSAQARSHSIRAAKNIVLTEEDFSGPAAEYFKVTGLTTASWPALAAGENITHSIVVTPLFTNYFNFSAASITYEAAEDTEVDSTPP